MTKPFLTASGDLVADRRADYAEMLFGSGEPAAAAEVMIGALEITPGWSLGWFRLGEFHEAAGTLAEAARAWLMAQAIDPIDRAGAALKLALIGATPAAEAPPSGYVETLFDQYASRFDHALVGTLGYRVPEQLLAAIVAQTPGRFGLAIDLGCGTGLMGERLRPVCDRLEGYDISTEMLRRARAKNVYDGLVKADLQALAYDGPPADLVVAADVFLYVGALDAIFVRIAAMLATDGLFAFSVEQLADSETYDLQPSRRYAHSLAYVDAALGRAGLAVRSQAQDIIRHDRGVPVVGLIVVAGRVAS